MFSRLLLTISAAISLTGLFLVYSVVVRPLATPAPESSREPEVVVERNRARRPTENVRVAETFLTDQAWAAASPYMFRAGQAFLYTNDWEIEKSSESVRFTPFAMIWMQKDKEGVEQAVTMVSESAQIRFASKFDARSPEPGRVVGAVLDGLVQVKGPDGLAIVGRRFIFDESAPSLVSTHPVQFQIDKHRGSARSLHVSLIPGEGLPGKDRPHVYGIRSVRLASGTDIKPRTFQHVRLDLQMKQDGELKPIKIRCSRDLEYDIASQTAVFSKEVVAYRTTGNGQNQKPQHDYIESETLKVHFTKKLRKTEVIPSMANDKTSASLSDELPATVVEIAGDIEPAEGRDRHTSSTQQTTSAQSTATSGRLGKRSYQRIETDLEFERLIAEGPVVKVVSHENGLNARMTRFAYDVRTRQLWMTDPKGVSVTQKGSSETTLSVPDIGLQLGDGDSLQDLLCRGKGRLESKSSGSNELAFIASWNNHLRKWTDTSSGLDVIELDNQASFRQPDKQTALGADVIRIWLAPLTASRKQESKNVPLEGTGLNMEVDGGSQKKATSSPALNMGQQDADIKRLHAEKNVALVSPMMIARTHDLDVRFEPASLAADLAHNSQARMTDRTSEAQLAAHSEVNGGKGVPLRRGSKVLTVAGTSLDPQDIEPDVSNRLPSETKTPKTRGKSPAESLDSTEPFELKADRIGVRLRKITGQTQPELAYAETHGNVEITQKRNEGEQPLKATGERMYLTAEAPHHEIVHLFGSPAHLRDRGMHIEGKDVHLDRQANRAWVKGNGLLQLPVPEDAVNGLGATANGDRELDVWWNESMEFDGQTARFIGKVRTELALTRINSERMDVELVSRLSFVDPKLSAQPALKSIECSEDVTFENSEYEGSKLVQVARGRVAEFKIDRTKNLAFAQGPGNMQLWRRGSSNGAGLAPRDVIQANRPITVVASDWDYTRVDFKGRMTGNIEHKQSTFYNSVRIVHGPVKRPNESIDADALPPAAGSMRCETLEFTHQPKGPGVPKAFHQLVGRGNSQIEGSGFYATADEITFDGSNDLYVLRALGRQNATIAQDVENGPRNEATGRRIQFVPSRNWVKVDQVSAVSGG